MTDIGYLKILKSICNHYYKYKQKKEDIYERKM